MRKRIQLIYPNSTRVESRGRILWPTWLARRFIAQKSTSHYSGKKSGCCCSSTIPEDDIISIINSTPTTTTTNNNNNNKKMATIIKRGGKRFIVLYLVLRSASMTNTIFNVMDEYSGGGHNGQNNLTAPVVASNNNNTNNNSSSSGRIFHHDENSTWPTITTASATRKDASTISISPNEDNSKYRLEFLHIQKTAGSLMEDIAFQQGITWGACHFNFPWKRRKKCPEIDERMPRASKCFWHYPLQHLPSFPVEPYDNILDPDLLKMPKRYFTVVRNPYKRLLSFYYMNMIRAKRKGPEAASKDSLNKYAQRLLDHATAVGLFHPNSTICQYPYLYHENGTKLVDHVVQFEYLAEDFNPLARSYNLNLSIPDYKVNAHTYNEETLTIRDFTEETIYKINSKCRKDFDLGRGYEMMEPKVEISTTTTTTTTTR